MENIEKFYTTKLLINGKTHTVDVYKIVIKDKFKESFKKNAKIISDSYGCFDLKVSTESFMCVMKMNKEKIESYGITAKAALDAMKRAATNYVILRG